MESMKASTVLLYESRNTFLGACHVLSREECMKKTFCNIFVGDYKLSWSAFQNIDLKGYI